MCVYSRRARARAHDRKLGQGHLAAPSRPAGSKHLPRHRRPSPASAPTARSRRDAVHPRCPASPSAVPRPRSIAEVSTSCRCVRGCPCRSSGASTGRTPGSRGCALMCVLHGRPHRTLSLRRRSRHAEELLRPNCYEQTATSKLLRANCYEHAIIGPATSQRVRLGADVASVRQGDLRRAA